MDILQRATQLLRPFMSEERRDTWLSLAFHAQYRSIYDAIPQAGATADFTVRCVRTLLDRGCLGPRHALSLLLEVVRNEAGAETQAQFQSLIDELDPSCSEARSIPTQGRDASSGTAPERDAYAVYDHDAARKHIESYIDQLQEALRRGVVDRDGAMKQLNALVALAQSAEQAAQYEAQELDEIFSRGSEASRIIALALAQVRPTPASLPTALHATTRPRSPWEQYLALLVLEALVPVLTPELRREVEIAIRSQQGGRAGEYITRENAGRWEVACRVLRKIEKGSARPATATSKPAPRASTPNNTRTRDLTGKTTMTSTAKILFLAASPDDQVKLALDQEAREIRTKIRASEHRDSLEFKTEWAVRPDDLLQYLNELKPQAVHFSGHGDTNELILNDENGRSKPVSAKALRALFELHKRTVRLVVLNACYSKRQAKALVEVIDCAIGMRRDIGDDAAIAFAAAFYRKLGFGASVKEAFEEGRVALMLQGIPEDKTPELLVKSGVDANQIFLTRADANPR
jgi:hypothetical protein